jgi:transcriptional regulator with XRE-family HTH domain
MNSNENKSFGWQDRIKERLKTLDMTQEKLARKSGVTRSAITHYLAGRRVPSLSQFAKLAEALETSPGWLQFGLHGFTWFQRHT